MSVVGSITANNCLVLAIGNVLLRDDGVGVQVLNALAERELPARIELLDGGTLSYSLANVLDAGTDLVVIDASHFGAVPGTVRCFEGTAMDRQLATRGRSVHEVGLADVLDMLRLTGQLPEKRALIGIEPAIIDWGETLSPAVRAAVPVAAEQIIGLLASWQTASAWMPDPGTTATTGLSAS